MEDSVTIDIDRLRDDLYNDLISSAFVGDFGGAFLQANDLDRMSPEQIVHIAISHGFTLNDYII